MSREEGSMLVGGLVISRRIDGSTYRCGAACVPLHRILARATQEYTLFSVGMLVSSYGTRRATTRHLTPPDNVRSGAGLPSTAGRKEVHGTYNTAETRFWVPYPVIGRHAVCSPLSGVGGSLRCRITLASVARRSSAAPLSRKQATR